MNEMAGTGLNETGSTPPECAGPAPQHRPRDGSAPGLGRHRAGTGRQQLGAAAGRWGAGRLCDQQLRQLAQGEAGARGPPHGARRPMRLRPPRHRRRPKPGCSSSTSWRPEGTSPRPSTSSADKRSSAHFECRLIEFLMSEPANRYCQQWTELDIYILSAINANSCWRLFLSFPLSIVLHQ